MRGGSKAVWNFSKNSSDLVAGSFPNYAKFDAFSFLICQVFLAGPPQWITALNVWKILQNYWIQKI